MESGKRNLARLAFVPLPLGSIRPRGWLLNQLKIQANGLTGHLDEFWPDIADSGWIGGKAEGWERAPYWLDGLVPLAYLLDDDRLKAKVRRWMDYIITHQQEDGWLGPVKDPSGRYQPYDPWPVFVMLKAMIQYFEASGDQRIIDSMTRFLRRLDALLDEKPLFVWGKSRWADLVVSIHWLFDRTGEEWLLDLAAKAENQGYNWREHFANFLYPNRLEPHECNQSTHVVNNAMAIKEAGVWYRQTGDRRDWESVFRAIETLDKYHGQVTGVFTGDEHYAGKNPSQGTELCAVVEYMFSLEVLLSIIGDPAFGDRLEKIAFNALPATHKPDMWAHQYDQQVNQVICRVSEDKVYATNGPYSNIFGLEPNYGCCTANMHQGFPKFTSHLWMRSPDGGIAAVAYAPSSVKTAIDGKQVEVELETDYPFSSELVFKVRTDEPVSFPLDLRIPGWAVAPEITIDDDIVIEPQKGGFHRITREWAGESRVVLRLPMKPVIRRGYNDSVAIERGALVYSLKIGEDWRLLRGELPHADWEVYPTTPWNYALKIDLKNPDRSVRFESKPVGDCPFSPEGAPIVARVGGRRLPSWQIEHNAAAPPPQSPVKSDEPIEELILIPYGCTNLRVTEFPLLDEE